jgi:hypothetical protein
MWWLLPTAALCGIGELAGWTGRLWSALSPTDSTPFTIQSVPIIFLAFATYRPRPQDLHHDHSADPAAGSELYDHVADRSTAWHTILVADSPALYVLRILVAFCMLIKPRGFHRRHDAFSPLRELSLVFKVPPQLNYVQDITALVVQAVGGAMASSASDLAGANLVRQSSFLPLLDLFTYHTPHPGRECHAGWDRLPIRCVVSLLTTPFSPIRFPTSGHHRLLGDWA